MTDAPGQGALAHHGDPQAHCTLYCLAHAGGSAVHAYHGWSGFLPPHIRVVPLDMPGHGMRLREPLVGTVDALVDDVLEQMGRAPGPIALFGHSFGAVVAYAVARRLCGQGRPPAALLVAGRNAPGEPLSHQPLHRLGDPDFVEALSRQGGIPKVMLGEPELLDLYRPVLRNDLRMAETWTRPPGPALNTPIIAYAAEQDPLTDVSRVASWDRETTVEFDLTVLPGGHFFLADPEFRADLAGRFRTRVGTWAAPPVPVSAQERQDR